MKSIVLKSPEYIVLIMVFLAGYTPPFYINPICIGIIVMLILQILYKNRILGLLIGTLYFLINLYFLGALLSEFNEFTTFNHSAKQLLIVGVSIWIINMIASSLMIYKYAIQNIKKKPSIAFKN
ncbi:hypothetical protein GCM10011344_36060 [Dokdonia pacifica]|uniref:Uncharacterized protein n=1 Tax=Dokdonia pacifica TaxID=1627892 RepID=A0A239AVU2_9FLAO|nr:hypothetical protein [Dokdonia pacifica]GGG31900.1 hypothetical protein GCM10011344_36060 [Dokdonia pacifica]SNR99452.1 hypothetical protein SAMN06265376_105153 [Dokdonia pacifica]